MSKQYMELSLDFDKSVWEKQPLLVRNLGKGSNYYRLFRGIFDALKDDYLDAGELNADDEFVFNESSFSSLASQLFVGYATGKFLDEHGLLNGLIRKFGEDDEAFRDRIKRKLNLLYDLPSPSEIIEYIKSSTGFEIEIETGDLVGCINPDDVDIEDVQQAGFSVRGEIPRLLHIYYIPDPALGLGSLREALDKVMFSFVKYYLFEVDNEEE